MRREVFWGVAVLAVGLAVGYWLGWETKRVVFLLVLVAGVYLLLLVRRPETKVAVGQTGETSIDELESGEGSLSPEEAREWLDRFLVEQQDKK